ncbi:mitochondrial K+-H+ exchange-related-domain-containing protein [Blyttiomyces helicus]|uniref:Mitochondrial K+-H+ exchange-related-domain-containing protein n=1 Tax=Blyttiomyces helicus TaxID=388810 RepID=A0A4P9WFF6_9FUNG|nr:mitochondrial K+-H+ exchange-related-domain-containing protein [Blyttiomyces helicus]|eukprot:RKO90585.1 mitochondrial K+-H+ exchange-related-domain-containing protein [Blyttiomyces helicus]
MAPTTAPSTTDPFLHRLLRNGVAKAVSQWDRLAVKPEGSVMKRVYVAGNNLMDRIPAEEWFLKVVPQRPRDADGRVVDFREWKDFKVVVSHPTILHSTQLHTSLTTLTATALPFHRKRLTLSVLLLPFSTLFMIVPGPNIPLFWNLFRVYSHWRALEGAKTLHALHSSGAIVCVPDPVIDECLLAWDEEKEGLIPDAVVKAFVEREMGGPHLEREVERVRKQADRRRKREGNPADGATRS